jgi:5-methylcytosine-specific restriction endonuclease McrA
MKVFMELNPCHLNPIYTRVDEKRIAYEETLARCQNCHQKNGVTQAYKHMTHRLRHKTSRSPQEIVSLCSKCHQDVDLMKTLKVTDASMTAVETYNHSIHGKAVALGSQEAADCISCHASNALHDIYKKDHGTATVNKDNLKTTCKQCHEKTNDRFIEIAVHSSIDRNEKPALFFASFGLKLALFATVFAERRGEGNQNAKF